MNKQSLLIPASILIAGLIVGFSLYYALSSKNTSQDAQAPVQQQQKYKLDAIPAPNKEDYILGNPNADIVIVEYSDLECPACKAFHPELKKLMEKYGKQGKVAWVFRYLPLTSLHPTAEKEAIFAECVAKKAGQEGFWKFVDDVFENTPPTSPIAEDKLYGFAEKLGVKKDELKSCVNSNYGKDKIAKFVEQATQATGGALFTPFSVVFVKDGGKFVLEGGMPFKVMDKMVEQLMQNKK